MAPVTQYVFAEMLGISEHFTAGSHEWLPYSVISTFPKQICKQQFAVQLIKADNPNNNLSVSWREWEGKQNFGTFLLK